MIRRLSPTDWQGEFDDLASGRHPRATYMVDVKMPDGTWAVHAADEGGLAKLAERGATVVEMDMVGFAADELAEMVALGELDPTDLSPV